MTGNSFNERIEPVLRRLPTLPGKQETIVAETMRLAMVYGITRTQDTPSGQAAGGTVKAVRQIDRLLETLMDVTIQIDELDGEAAGAIRKARERSETARRTNEANGIYRRADKCPDTGIFQIGCFALAHSLSDAARELRAGEQRRPAKRRNLAAAALTRRARGTYKRLTGKKPTIITRQSEKAGGPFLDFLSDLFDALDIKASPESQARAVQKSREKR